MPQPGSNPSKPNFWQRMKNFSADLQNVYKQGNVASNPRAGGAAPRQTQQQKSNNAWAARYGQQTKPQQQTQGQAQQTQKPFAQQMKDVYNPKTNPALMDPRINSQAAIEQGKKAGYTPVVVDSYYGQAKPDTSRANNAWAARYQSYWENQFKKYSPDAYKGWAATGQRYRTQATADWVSETRRNRAWANRLTGQAAEYESRPYAPLEVQQEAPASGGGYGGYGDYGDYGGGGGGYSYTPDPARWYANMTQWNINNPQPG